MPTIELPDNLGTVTHGIQEEADRTKAILHARRAFTLKYCQEQGWPSNPRELLIEQVMQIRDQEGWKNPVV